MDTLGDNDIVCRRELWLNIFTTTVLKQFGKSRTVYFATEHEMSRFMREMRHQIYDWSMHGISAADIEAWNKRSVMFNNGDCINLCTSKTNECGVRIRPLAVDIVFIHWDDEHRKQNIEFLGDVLLESAEFKRLSDVYITRFVSIDDDAIREEFVTALSDPYWNAYTPSVFRMVNFSRIVDDVLAEKKNPGSVDMASLEKRIARCPASIVPDYML